MLPASNASLLYDQVADDIARLIIAGVLRAGHRLPSLRALSAERGVSIATVQQAYARLERDGLAEARPKSGYFVCRSPALPLAEPRSRARKSLTPRRVTVTEGITRMVAAMRDPNVVPLGAACVAPELLAIRSLNRVLASIAKEMGTAGAAYDAPPGLLALRRQLAKRSLHWGLALREDELLTTAGAAGALLLCLRAVAKPGDAIAVESPTHYGILQLIGDLGLRAIEVPCHPRWGLDLHALEDVLRTARPRAVLTSTNGSNPLGVVLSDEAKETLVGLVRRYDVALIEDDVYGDLCFDGTRPRPSKAFDRDGRVLLCGSISKTMAQGYRVGWVAGGRYQTSLERLTFLQSAATSTLPQMAVAELLAGVSYDRHLRSLRRALASQVERVRAAIAQYFPTGTRVSSPQAGFVLWVELPAGNRSALDLQTRALEQQISIAPGPIFSVRPRFTNCIRLSCGFPWSPTLDHALQVLGELASTAET